MSRTACVGGVLLLAVTGCVHAPEIVMVDRATALEQQAAGSFDDVELKLSRSGITPVPVPLTPEQLEGLGIMPLPLVNNTGLTDADQLDLLLKQHCVGEGRDGLLVDTHDACKGAADHALALSLMERVNHGREQLWRWMHEEQPKVSETSVRKNWWKLHARGVTCGAWSEKESGGWEEKKC